MKRKILKIYQITNIVNQKIYIGKTIHTLHRRFKQHVHSAFSSDPRFKHIKLYEAMRKYGTDNFNIKLLDTAQNEIELNQKEKYWIQKLDSRNPEIGYNMLVGGEGGCTPEAAKRGIETKRKNGTLNHSEETKKKISLAHQGQKFTEEHKKHLSENHRLKTTHVLLYKDGHTEVTKKSVAQIAKSVGISASMLRNYSTKGDPHQLSFYIADIEKYDESFYHLFISTGEKCYLDPIAGDLVTFDSLVARKKNKPLLYQDIISHQCLTKPKQLKKINYINNRKEIIRNALNLK